MATIPPIIRHMLICDGVNASGDPARPNVTVRGMAHVIRARPGESFPITHPALCVYLVFTGGVGKARGQVLVTDDEAELPLFGTGAHEIEHLTSRHEEQGVAFVLLNCVFRRPGLYWVEFRHDDIMLRREPLIVR